LNAIIYMFLKECIWISEIGWQEDYMSEQEALIRRRELLNDNISKMAYEIWKIDNRLASLRQATKPNGFGHVMHRAKVHASLN
jgi:hypothetical protein